MEIVPCDGLMGDGSLVCFSVKKLRRCNPIIIAPSMSIPWPWESCVQPCSTNSRLMHLPCVYTWTHTTLFSLPSLISFVSYRFWPFFFFFLPAHLASLRPHSTPPTVSNACLFQGVELHKDAGLDRKYSPQVSSQIVEFFLLT